MRSPLLPANTPNSRPPRLDATTIKSRQLRDAVFAEYRATHDKVRVALVAVEIVGSERQAELAGKLRAEMTALTTRAGASAELESLRDQFLEQARKELGRTDSLGNG